MVPGTTTAEECDPGMVWITGADWREVVPPYDGAARGVADEVLGAARTGAGLYVLGL